MWVPPFKETPTSPHLKAVEFLLLLVHPQAWAHSQWPHSLWPHSLLLPSVVCSSASNEKRSTTSSDTFGETAGLGMETNIIQHDLYRMQAGKNISMVVHPFYQTNPNEVFGYSLCTRMNPWTMISHDITTIVSIYEFMKYIYWQYNSYIYIRHTEKEDTYTNQYYLYVTTFNCMYS